MIQWVHKAKYNDTNQHVECGLDAETILLTQARWLQSNKSIEPQSSLLANFELLVRPVEEWDPGFIWNVTSWNPASDGNYLSKSF